MFWTTVLYMYVRDDVKRRWCYQ